MLNLFYRPQYEDSETRKICEVFNRMGLPLQINSVVNDFPGEPPLVHIFPSACEYIFKMTISEAKGGGIGGSGISGAGATMEEALSALYSDFKSTSRGDDCLCVPFRKEEAHGYNFFKYDRKNDEEILAGTVSWDQAGIKTMNFNL